MQEKAGSTANRIDLTKRNIDRIPFSENGQILYWDNQIPGFGLLVGKRSKTFLVQVDVKDPTKRSGYRTVKKTLGRYGDLTPEQARKLVGGHHDNDGAFIPGKRLELKHQKDRAGESVTLTQLLSEYFSEKKTRSGHEYKPATVKGYTDIIKRQFPTWLQLCLPDLAGLAPATIIGRYKEIEVASGAMAARNAFVMLQAVLKYGTIKYPKAIPTNPLQALAMSNIRRPIRAREDCLKGEEHRTFYEGIQHFNEVTRDAYLFCLYQGLRNMEAAPLRWDHVDLDNATLKIPDTKNRHPLHVPLCRQSLAILERRKQKAIEGNLWVFPSPRDAHLNKRGHIRLMSAALKLNTKLEITVHGLRRTFITTGRRLKLFRDTDRLTNHVDSSIAGKHYDQTDVDDLRHSLQLIANELERLMTTTGKAKVIRIA